MNEPAPTVLFSKGETERVEKVEKMQVRESGVPVPCHRNFVVSSLDADHANPRHPPAGRMVVKHGYGEALETGGDTHTKGRDRRSL